MSDFLDEVREDCQAAEEDLGSPSAAWSGNPDFSYPCAPSLVRRGTLVVIGGREVEIKLTLRVRNAGTTADGSDWDFTTNTPKSGDTVTFKSVRYRIAQVNHAHGSFMEWDLMEAAR